MFVGFPVVTHVPWLSLCVSVAIAAIITDETASRNASTDLQNFSVAISRRALLACGGGLIVSHIAVEEEEQVGQSSSFWCHSWHS